MFSLVFLCKGSFSLTALTRRRSCAGLRLSKNFSPPSHLSSSPLPFRKRVQKYYLFPNWQALFSFIFQVSHITLIVREKFFRSKVQAGKTCTLLYITMTHQWGKKASSIWVISGMPLLKTIEMMSKRVLMSSLFWNR